MEIEFKVQILPNEMRQTLYACASFAGGVALSTILLGFYFKNFWPALGLIGMFLCWRCFSEYRKIVKQKRFPDVLRIEDASLLYLKNGKKTLRIPYNAIREIRYEKGLAVSLKQGARVELLDTAFHLASLKKKNGSLFFEWFGSSVKAGLDNVVHANQPNHFRAF